MHYDNFATPANPSETESKSARVRGSLICAHLVLTMLLTVSVATQSSAIEYREGDTYIAVGRLISWHGAAIMWSFVLLELLAGVQADLRIKAGVLVLLLVQLAYAVCQLEVTSSYYYENPMPNFRSIVMFRVDRTTVPYFALMLVSLALSICYRRVPIRFNSQQLLWFVAITAVILGIFQNLWLGGLAPMTR